MSIYDQVENLYDSIEGECENHSETCTECGKCDLGHALNEAAETLRNGMKAAQQKIKEAQANTQHAKQAIDGDNG